VRVGLDYAAVATAADPNVARALEVLEQVLAQAADPLERRMLQAAGDLLRAVGNGFEADSVVSTEIRRALSD
jgi:hypothetical protein